MKVKKILPFLLAFAMIGGTFAGCKSGSDKNKDEGETPKQEETETPKGEEETEKPESGDKETETPKQDEEETSALTPLPAGKKIYIVGDSTVCSFTDNYYLPRYGYGTQLAEYLNVTSDQIVNLAMSGRSSKSFLSEANYTTLKNSIAEGDYLIIGFGHNDEKSAEPARFTDPNGTITQQSTEKGTSLKWNINEYYIKLAKDKGATPILCTPITRYDSSGEYTGNKVHVTSDGDYPTAIKGLGEETNTTVIDLTALTVAEYKKDNAAARYYHAATTYSGEIKTAPATGNIYDGTETPDGWDDTHINMYGAKMVAYQFANALASTECSLKNHVKESIAAPTKTADYVSAINQNFVRTSYEAFDPAAYEANKLGTTTTNSTTVTWYKTVMGQLGGETKVSSYTTTYSDGKFTLVTDKGSKFASNQDGFGAAFVQIPASKNFTSSAHVKVTAFVATNVAKQAGFGMMLRDDILMDTYDATLASNYVAAGLQTVDNGDPFAIWSRASGTMAKNTSNKTSYAVGSEYDVSITRVGQTVTVTFADGTNTYTGTYTDFDFVARDNDYMYLCLFAARGFTVEFTNVAFEITGESQGA